MSVGKPISHNTSPRRSFPLREDNLVSLRCISHKYTFLPPPRCPHLCTVCRTGRRYPRNKSSLSASAMNLVSAPTSQPPQNLMALSPTWPKRSGRFRSSFGFRCSRRNRDVDNLKCRLNESGVTPRLTRLTHSYSVSLSVSLPLSLSLSLLSQAKG
jgi:hypothetical protein